MERIQSAIAKARAARSAQETPGTQEPPPSTEGTSRPRGPAPAPAQPTSAQKDTAAAWAAITPFAPDVKQMHRSRLVSYFGGREAVSYDMMRTKVQQQMRANNWTRLAITSPTSACGKTTTSLNLAFSLARQADVRTVLCEIDLRRPAMARTLGLTRQQAFAQVLDGSAPIEDHLVRYGNNLCFGTNSAPARNPAELLHNPHVGTALADIEARYDPSIMIFDMPPMLVSDDTMAFIGHVDCVLLIGAAEASTTQEIDVCEQELASQTNVLGVVLNKCRYLDKSYGYSYYG